MTEREKRYDMFMAGMSAKEIAEKEGVHIATVYQCIRVIKKRIEENKKRTDIRNQSRWSTTPPTMPGWYWWKSPNSDAMLVKISRFMFDDEMVIQCVGTDTITPLDAVRNNSKWCGPLTPPE